MKGRKGRIFALLLMILGVIAFGTPFAELSLEDLREERARAEELKRLEGFTKEETKALKEKAKAYDKTLDAKGGSVVDPWAVDGYRQSAGGDLSEDDAFGFLEIPRLEVRGRLYLGASEKHLLAGLAQVEGTSLPLGGKGTRSVIAGHRGIRRAMLFRYIDLLEPGDRIVLYVPDGPLIYAVTDQEVIAPSQNDRLTPVAGKDMITLLTCHPFPVNNKRLLVNAERVVEEKVTKKEEKEVAVAPTVVRQKVLYKVAAAGSLLVLLVLLVLLGREIFRK